MNFKHWTTLDKTQETKSVMAEGWEHKNQIEKNQPPIIRHISSPRLAGQATAAARQGWRQRTMVGRWRRLGDESYAREHM